MVKKNKSKFDNDVFQRNMMASPRCKGCSRHCIVVYDRHHDEYFSETCGTVIMSMGVFLIPYNRSDEWI